MIKAIIFDMDGLMFDTEKLWEEAFIALGNKLGYPVTASVHDKTICTNIYQMEEVLVDCFGSDFPFNDFYQGCKKYMNDVIVNEGIRVKPGLYELIDYLKDNGYKIGIASSSDKEIIRRNLASANIGFDDFDAIVSGEDFQQGKPNPDIYLKACQLLGVESSMALVLEDANNGIIAANKAGCKVGLVPDINVILDDVKDLTDYQFASLHDAIAILDKQK